MAPRDSGIYSRFPGFSHVEQSLRLPTEGVKEARQTVPNLPYSHHRPGVKAPRLGAQRGKAGVGCGEGEGSARVPVPGSCGGWYGECPGGCCHSAAGRVAGVQRAGAARSLDPAACADSGVGHGGGGDRAATDRDIRVQRQPAAPGGAGAGSGQPRCTVRRPAGDRDRRRLEPAGTRCDRPTVRPRRDPRLAVGRGGRGTPGLLRRRAVLIRR